MIHLYRVRVSAIDDHSGVRKVSFRFIVNGTEIEKAKKDFFIETQVLSFLLLRHVRFIF